MSMCQKLAASILFLLCGTLIVFGQGSYTAQIRGTVKDQSGAVVQSATVTITNDATGISVVAHSNQEGLYILTGLRPATYTLKAEAVGFRGVERKNVVLAVSQDTTVDLSMNPLTVTETMVVTGAPPLLDTESAALGTDVTNEYVRDIPLYNRSLFGLVYLAGGVTETTGSGINDNYPTGTNFVSNGQRNATAEIRMDGALISAPEQGEGGNSNVYYEPLVEGVQEFKVQSNAFSAEFGSNGGTVVNMALKSGTNALHGRLYDYFDNDALNARSFFQAVPTYVRQNEGGVTIGGPIVIPKIYNGHNKTFYFFTYGGSRSRSRSRMTAVRHSSSEISRKVFAGGPPALVTQMSTRPKRFSTASTNCCTRAASVTSSACQKIALPVVSRMLLAVRSTSAAFRAQMATCAPSRPSSAATARPSPLLAATTIATRPFSPRSIGLLLSRGLSF